MEALLKMPKTGLATWVDSVVTHYRKGQPLALLFDYDGTLTPIVTHPSLAHLSAQTRQRLAALRDLSGVAVGVVSSRSLRDVRELTGLPGLFYAGSGGLELDVYGNPLTYPEAEAFRLTLKGLLGSLVRIVTSYPGAWVERKAVTCSLHFRALPPLRALAFQREVSSVLNSRPSVRYRIVSQAIEISPAAGWDKGTAVAAMLAWLGDGAMPVYAGDAANDTEAMAVASCLGGVAIGVGPEAPALATYRHQSPDELALALDSLLAGLARSRTPSVRRASARASEDGGSAATSEADSSGPGILVIDADPRFRQQTAEGLRAEGWRVWEAGTVEQALNTLRRSNGQIKAAVVDLQMPGIAGWRALKELGATNPSVVRCATTAGVSATAAEAFRSISDTPLFVRPFPVKMVSSELLRRLREGESNGES